MHDPGHVVLTGLGVVHDHEQRPPPAHRKVSVGHQELDVPLASRGEPIGQLER
jgi:hypothetical protein